MKQPPASLEQLSDFRMWGLTVAIGLAMSWTIYVVLLGTYRGMSNAYASC